MGNEKIERDMIRVLRIGIIAVSVLMGGAIYFEIVGNSHTSEFSLWLGISIAQLLLLFAILGALYEIYNEVKRG